MTHQVKEYQILKRGRVVGSIGSTKFPKKLISDFLKGKRKLGEFIIRFSTVQKMGRSIIRLICFKSIDFDGEQITRQGPYLRFNKNTFEADLQLQKIVRNKPVFQEV